MLEVFFSSQVIIYHMFIPERHSIKNTRVTLPLVSETMCYKHNHMYLEAVCSSIT